MRRRERRGRRARGSLRNCSKIPGEGGGRALTSLPFARSTMTSARWEGGIVRYPDPAVEVLDPRFARLRLAHAAVERIATGYRWCEGPVWFGDGGYLLWSDIPNNRIMR